MLRVPSHHSLLPYHLFYESRQSGVRSGQGNFPVFIRREPSIFPFRNSAVLHPVRFHVPDTVGKDMAVLPETVSRFSGKSGFQFLLCLLCPAGKGHGKFPHGSQHAPGRPFVKKHLSILHDNGAGRFLLFLRFLRRPFRQFLLFLLIRFFGRILAVEGADKGVQRGLITLVSAILFCVVLDPLGFIPTAIIFLAFMMWVMGNRKPAMLAIAPPLVTLTIWLVFEKVLNLSMPAGILVDIL